MDGKPRGRNFETELPEGYEAVFKVDVTNKRFAIIMNLAALIITAALVFAAVKLVRPQNFLESFAPSKLLVYCAALIAYIVLHELVHGIAYKLLTRQKLKFGLTAGAAYCGVPDIYVYRRAGLIALLAPFTVFNIVFLAMAFFMPNQWDRFFSALLFAFHFGGCAGDLYMTYLFMTRFKDKRTLTRDFGPAAVYYLPKERGD